MTQAPNPMNSRCGLEDCDCEYTIGGLLRRLEMIMESCRDGLYVTDKDAVFRAIHLQAQLTVEKTRVRMAPGGKPFVRPLYHPLICPCGHTQAMECDDTCLCYVAGSEAERQPTGQ
ncbi:hypothetical protein LCGC14_1124730 [marine sediment metagenome]|uniref:Uncharacterized protein n=1 Tax=marine sediment metagenome TaxID=412755 RepID=A0A0F9MQT9_9ZZZZ